MPQRHVHILLFIMVASLACFERASGRYEPYTTLFTQVIEQVDQNYVTEVDLDELVQSSINGLLEPLDEHTAFIPPVQYNQFQEGLEQKFGGVGIQVRVDDETQQLLVVSPLVGTPAYEAGIVAGDLVVEVDGKPTAEMSLEDAVMLMKGTPGDPVKLSVLHPGAEAPVDIEIQRAVIEVDTVLGDSRDENDEWNFFLAGDDKIGYIRIVAFSESTIAELDAAISWLEERDVQALILDLRNNPGGYLAAAVEVCDRFVDDGVIVSTRGRRRQEIAHMASRENTRLRVPMVVMVNNNSASASEIVAACLQDHDVAVVVGERSWGKGSVQNVINLADGRSALKLTVATYWRPNGHNIHRLPDATEDDEWGVMPNEGFLVELTEDDFVKAVEARRMRDIVGAVFPATDDSNEDSEKTDEVELFVDPQLKKAIEYLQEKLNSGSAKAAA